MVGLPEKEEGSDACAFLEKFLPETLELGESVTPLIIEESPSNTQLSSKKTDKMVSAAEDCHNEVPQFKQKEHVLKAAKRKGVIAYKVPIFVFSGFVGRASQGTTKVRCCPSKIAWQRNHPTQSNLLLLDCFLHMEIVL